MQRLQLLGTASVDQTATEQGSESPAPRFRSRRTVALLGYLVAERRPIGRDHLAALFWPDVSLSAGRGKLRRELHNLARMLPECWESDRHAVAFIPSAETKVDVYQVAELETERRWREAAELLNGEFLEGISLDESSEFEHWLLGERERWRERAKGVLRRVIQGHSRRGQYVDALLRTQQLLQFAPWDEEAHRDAMRFLAWTGQRGAALRQFERCQGVLREELAVEPDPETAALHLQIEAGSLDLPPRLPAFLSAEKARHPHERPLFVGRERQLARLDSFLESALAGRGQVVFVTGDPGRGKSALLEAFAGRAMERHPELLVAGGKCNAYSGLGDPYLPYRDLIGMLTGDVEGRWDAGAISRDHAQRLWAAYPGVVQTLLDHGPHLLDLFVPAGALLSRFSAAEPEDAPWLGRLREHAQRDVTRSGEVEQSNLFQQLTDVLLSVSRNQPLTLILDDIQWADAASISLLFHLGRRLADAECRALIICAYRPEEVAVGRAGDRHPLAKVLGELRRAYGDAWVDLDRADEQDGRGFVDALLDAQPNRLGEGFRAALFGRSEGHPLFTVELLRAMQERGDLLQDDDGAWMEGASLNWEMLPARVEAVIEERIDRLDPGLRELLTIASVEGESFTAQVLANVANRPERAVLRTLSAELERRHRLVREDEEVETSLRRLSRYRFGHILFQEFLYRGLGQGERRLLHGGVAEAQENLYAGDLDEMTVGLAHHYDQAGDRGRAFHYHSLAGERAARLYDYGEAISHYSRAIALAEALPPDPVSLIELHRGRGLAHEKLGGFDQAHADHTTVLEVAEAAGDGRAEWRAYLDLGKLWGSQDYTQTRDYFERALELARRMDDPAALAGSLNWMGNWHTNADEPLAAVAYHQQALEIVEQLGDRRELADTLDLLGITHLLGGDLTAAVRTYNRAIALSRELEDRPHLVSGLIARGVAVSVLLLLASAPPIPSPDSLSDLREAIRVAHEIGSASDEAWAHWALGQLHIVRGRYGRALETIQRGLDIATQIGHREWIVGNRCALGNLYLELLAPEEARREFEAALSLAEELRSQVWIQDVTGGLTGAYCLLDDRQGTQKLNESALSAELPMDSGAQRYCWARWANLALCQGDPALALEIVDRLIAAAPGMTPGRVITYLWKLKAEASAGLGKADEAEALLRAALENAQATGERYLLWRTHASLGRLYRATGRGPEAEKEWTIARELVQELADTLSAGELRDNFLARARARLRSTT